MYRTYPFERETKREKIRRVLVNHRWVFTNREICKISLAGREGEDKEWEVMCTIWEEKVINNTNLPENKTVWKKLPMSFDNTAFIRDPDWGDMCHREPVYAYLDKWGMFYEDWEYKVSFYSTNKGWKEGEKVAREDRKFDDDDYY